MTPKSFVFFFALCGLVMCMSSCSDVEFNNPAFQADLNNRLWRAETFKASKDENGNLIITATNNIQSIVLTIQPEGFSGATLGPDWNSKAEFFDEFGNVYTTDIDPDENVSVYRDLGEIEFSSNVDSSNAITGNFYFVAYDENGQNPVGLSNGIFLNVKLN